MTDDAYLIRDAIVGKPSRQGRADALAALNRLMADRTADAENIQALADRIAVLEAALREVRLIDCVHRPSCEDIGLGYLDCELNRVGHIARRTLEGDTREG